MTQEDARALFGVSFVGPEELFRVAPSFALGKLVAPNIPFADDTLRSASANYVLFYAPHSHVDGRQVSINSLRDCFGSDPTISQPCFYNQDWYEREDFASTPLDDRWHLLPKTVLESARGKDPEQVRFDLPAHQTFPTAVVCTFAFFAYWIVSGGRKLWNNDYLWCNDVDHQGDRVYVGRYEDPSGINKPGFNIHRYLSLRHMHSAAIELV